MNNRPDPTGSIEILGAGVTVRFSESEYQTIKKKAGLYRILFFVAVALMVFTNACGIYFAWDEIKDSRKNPYPLIDPARQFISGDNYVVNLQPLRTALKDLVAKEGPETIAIYYEQLNSGANISINENLRLSPASLIKLPVALAVMKKVEDGKWRMDDQLVYLEQDKDGYSGELYQSAVGSSFTVERLLRELLIHSDNTAYRIFTRNLNDEDLKNVIDEIGLDNLFDENGKITAKEYSRLMRALYTSSFLAREDSQQILKWLDESDFHDYLSQGVPDSVQFSHKYGENKNLKTLADSGIVYYDTKPYLITVIMELRDTSDEERSRGLKIMKEISEKAFEFDKTGNVTK